MLFFTARIFLGLFSVASFASVAYISLSYANLSPTISESEAVVKSTTLAKRESLEQLVKNHGSNPNEDSSLRQLPLPSPAPRELEKPVAESLPRIPPVPATNKKMIFVKKIQVSGNTVFQTEINSLVQPLPIKYVTLEELQETVDAITKLYLERGFLTSSASLIEESLSKEVVKISVIEGTLEKIEIDGNQHLNKDYILSQIKLGAGTPLNVFKLEDQLRLLRADPLFENVEATLKQSGQKLNQSILVIRVIEADPYQYSRRNTRQVSEQVEALNCVQPARIYVSFLPPNIISDESPVDFPTQPDDRLTLLLVTAEGKVTWLPIPGATRKIVSKVADQFRSRILFDKNDPYPSRPYLEQAQQLYQWLVAPLEKQLVAKEIDHLIFVMDIKLRSLPLAALHDGQKFLVEKYSVGLMPSLNLVNTCYLDIQSMQVLAMGAELFTDPALAPLPFVPAELSNIMKLWPGHVLLNEEFSLFALREFINRKRRLQPFQIIHLASSASFVSGDPEKSFINLRDSELRLDQLLQLNLKEPPVELLVLSAAQTALGDRDSEFGFAGMAVKAGAKSALGSLWEVSDEGTLAVMVSFYEQLKQAPIKAEALRQAQLAMSKGKVRLENGELVTEIGNFPLPPHLAERGNRDLSHPYYWSGFTIIGSPW